MNFENLITYQKKDIECKKLGDELKKNPDHMKMKECKERFDAAKQKLVECEAVASASIGAYDGAKEFLAANVARAEQLAKKLSSDGLSPEEEEALAGELEALRAQIGEWEHKVKQAKENADKAISDYTGANKSGVQAKTEFTAAKEKFERFKAEHEKKMAAAKAERDGLEKSVEPELLALYKSVVAENIFPAFVVAVGDAALPSCGACGMQLAAQANNELTAHGYCRCETCRRVIYKK